MRADAMQVDPRQDPTTPRLRHRRRLGTLGLVALLAIPPAGATCEIRERTHQSARVLCTIDGDSKTKVVRFEASFGGFHDDSVVEMTLRLDEAGVTCGAHDRTTLSGESGDEGDVLLSCRVQVAPVDGRARVLEGLLGFRHAELLSVGVVREVTDSFPATSD
jgi:hypothetical protein